MVGLTAKGTSDVLTSATTVTPVPSTISIDTSYVSATTTTTTATATISGVYTITASDVIL